jgi:hypothetical protein
VTIKVNTPTLFDRAAKVFDGWTDPDTGVRVLRIFTRGEMQVEDVLQTPYHQCRPFLDGGRKALLRTGKSYSGQGGTRSVLLDLTTGEIEEPFPPGCQVMEVIDGAYTAPLVYRDAGESRAVLWDMRTGRELASISSDGWRLAGFFALADGRRALAAHLQGRPYHEFARSHFHLLSPNEPPRVVLEAEGYSCNHIQGCPTDPEMYAYDRWPSPIRPVEQAIHIATLDGSVHEPAKLDEHALRPVDMWGCRDHYVWTPDGSRIVSYLNPKPMEHLPRSDEFNHFTFEWWLSALDWRTGEDLSARYPPGRWGGHMQITPDSRYILCCGGPGFDRLFAVEIDGLRQGWNEHVICSYPTTVSAGKNSDPFPYPFALPDGSGVIFNAGWHGTRHGVYLAEWPDTLL